MASVSRIPKSKAKTAYGLLSEIREVILAEPKRYDQFDVLNIGEDAERAYPDVPSCGTVGCVAGWTVALTFKNPEQLLNVLSAAETKLGLDDEQADELFGEMAAGNTESQSLEHALAGAKHIAAFQRRYRKQLLAKKV